jgi:hypothetical protein
VRRAEQHIPDWCRGVEILVEMLFFPRVMDAVEMVVADDVAQRADVQVDLPFRGDAEVGSPQPGFRPATLDNTPGTKG